MIKSGCCGWKGLNPKDLGLDNWKEEYPSKLALYASIFPCVEVNRTFYHLPQLKTTEKWFSEARSARSDFKFMVKVPQTITHRDRFQTNASIDAYDAVTEVAKALNAEILLFQTPSSLRDPEPMERFFSEIDQEFTFALEPRGLPKEEAFELCRKFEMVYCFDPFAQLPEDPPGKVLYLRLHGSPPGDRMYRYEYSKKDFEWLKNVIEKYGKNCYCLFNNISMYESANLFGKMT